MPTISQVFGSKLQPEFALFGTSIRIRLALAFVLGGCGAAEPTANSLDGGTDNQSDAAVYDTASADASNTSIDATPDRTPQVGPTIREGDVLIASPSDLRAAQSLVRCIESLEILHQDGTRETVPADARWIRIEPADTTIATAAEWSDCAVREESRGGVRGIRAGSTTVRVSVLGADRTLTAVLGGKVEAWSPPLDSTGTSEWDRRWGIGYHEELSHPTVSLPGTATDNGYGRGLGVFPESAWSLESDAPQIAQSSPGTYRRYERKLQALAKGQASLQWVFAAADSKWKSPPFKVDVLSGGVLNRISLSRTFVLVPPHKFGDCLDVRLNGTYDLPEGSYTDVVHDATWTYPTDILGPESAIAGRFCAKAPGDWWITGCATPGCKSLVGASRDRDDRAKLEITHAEVQSLKIVSPGTFDRTYQMCIRPSVALVWSDGSREEVQGSRALQYSHRVEGSATTVTFTTDAQEFQERQTDGTQCFNVRIYGKEETSGSAKTWVYRDTFQLWAIHPLAQGSLSLSIDEK